MIIIEINSTPQPPYGGSHGEAENDGDILGALAATLCSRSYVLPDYGLLILAVQTELNARTTHLRRTDCYCGQARLLLDYV
jgi:hypothetical protein